MSILRYFLQRNIFSWFFEVLPLCLLVLQSVASIRSGGDVDRWSRPGRMIGGLSSAGSSAVAGFLGKWNIEERSNMDEFLERLGFPNWQRALICRAGQQYYLEQKHTEKGEALRIVTSDLRGTTELELPLDGQDVSANDGDGGQKVCRSAKVNRDSVVITERFRNERQPYSECRRTLQPDGRMRIDVKKRTAAGHMVGMRAIAAKV